MDLEALVRAIGVEHIQIVDPLKLDDLEKALQEALNREEPSVIITKRPCVLLSPVAPELNYVCG